MVEFLRKFPFQKMKRRPSKMLPGSGICFCAGDQRAMLFRAGFRRRMRASQGAPTRRLKTCICGSRSRNNYLNFYRAGQSVAKVGFVNGRLTAKIHNKYVYSEKGEGQRYVKLTGSKLVDDERDIKGLRRSVRIARMDVRGVILTTVARKSSSWIVSSGATRTRSTSKWRSRMLSQKNNASRRAWIPLHSNPTAISGRSSFGRPSSRMIPASAEKAPVGRKSSISSTSILSGSAMPIMRLQ